MENLFEKAVREKFRFNYKGLISVEDLWDLDLEILDSIFKSLNAKLKSTKEESLLNIKTKEDNEIALKVAIIKYIVEIKLKEITEKQLAKSRAEQKQKILSILANKEDMSLQNKSPEELKQMLETL
jgi:hypothetical protein